RFVSPPPPRGPRNRSWCPGSAERPYQPSPSRARESQPALDCLPRAAAARWRRSEDKRGLEAPAELRFEVGDGVQCCVCQVVGFIAECGERLEAAPAQK